MIRGENHQVDGSGLHYLNFQPSSREDIAQLEKNDQKIIDGFNALLDYFKLDIREVNKPASNHIQVYKKGKKK
jgi:hypothetical protein